MGGFLAFQFLYFAFRHVYNSFVLTDRLVRKHHFVTLKNLKLSFLIFITLETRAVNLTSNGKNQNFNNLFKTTFHFWRIMFTINLSVLTKSRRKATLLFRKSQTKKFEEILNILVKL